MLWNRNVQQFKKTIQGNHVEVTQCFYWKIHNKYSTEVPRTQKQKKLKKNYLGTGGIYSKSSSQMKKKKPRTVINVHYIV